MNQSSRVLYLSLLLKVQCCIVYVINLLEFYLVRGIACLLIPLFFIDATKSFATNIIRTVFSYFVKVLVNVTMCFFALNMLCTSCVDMVSEDMGTVSDISGARRAFDTTTKGLEELNSVYKDKGEAGFSQREIENKALGAAFKTIGSAGLQSMGDSLYKAFTGQDKRRSEDDGKTLSFGQEFKDEGGHMRKADFGDMQRQAGTKGDAIGNDTVAKLKEQYDKHLPPDDQDAFTPKKK